MDTVERSENGRNANGTFGAGNQFASRQQRRQHVSKLRDSVLQRLTPESVVELVDALLIKAKGGDLPAIRCALGLIGRYKENSLFPALDDMRPVVQRERSAESAEHWKKAKQQILAAGGENAARLQSILANTSDADRNAS